MNLKCFDSPLSLCLALLMLQSIVACQRTKYHHDVKVDENLGFEIFENNLPVNWIIYAPEDAVYRVTADTNVYCEGKKSLRFDLIESAHKGEENYTGFTSEFISLTKGKGRCQLSFRVINQGAKFMVYVNATNAKSSGGSPVLIEETASFSAWKRYEATIDIPDDMWLRFEIKIFGTGVFRIDDVRINQL